MNRNNNNLISSLLIAKDSILSDFCRFHSRTYSYLRRMLFRLRLHSRLSVIRNKPFSPKVSQRNYKIFEIAVFSIWFGQCDTNQGHKHEYCVKNNFAWDLFSQRMRHIFWEILNYGHLLWSIKHFTLRSIWNSCSVFSCNNKLKDYYVILKLN